MSAAHWAATQSTCLRRRVGAALVIDGTVVSTGCNHIEPSVAAHDCAGGGCPRGQQSYADVPAFSDYGASAGAAYCPAVHAEVSAVRAFFTGYRVKGIQKGGFFSHTFPGAILEVTCEPCPGCEGYLMWVGLPWKVV